MERKTMVVLGLAMGCLFYGGAKVIDDGAPAVEPVVEGEVEASAPTEQASGEVVSGEIEAMAAEVVVERTLSNGAPFPSGPLSQMFGINEAISYPQRMEDRQGTSFDEMRGHFDESGAAAIEVGATWSRGHTVAFPRLSWDRWEREGRSWDRADAWVAAMQRAGLEPVIMLGPWPGNRTRQATSSFDLGDRERDYLVFLHLAVERYDGDGFDDMPGLERGIHHWEIDNEPDLKFSGGPRGGGSSDFCTPQQFADLLIKSSRAIHDADSEAVVLNGGLWSIMSEAGGPYAEELFAIDGVLDAIDVVSVHAYHHGPGVEHVVATIEKMRSLAPGKTVWLTETGVPSIGDRRYIGEEWQGEIVYRTLITALAYGVERLFWHTLFDPPPSARRPRAGYATHSLLAKSDDNDDLREKPAGAAYRDLATLLSEYSWEDVESLDVEGGAGVVIGDDLILVYGEELEIAVDFEVTAASRLVDDQAVAFEVTDGGSTVALNGYAALLSR